ncbi:MAG: asparagine synthase C-terminal domain-containing protein [Candidatus Nanoarchaeia archaeon]
MIKLHSQKEWTARIAHLKKNNFISSASKKDLIDALANKIEETIVRLAKQAQKKGDLAVLFSGGVDSTLIAFVLQKNAIPFKAITVGFYDINQRVPEDIESSREIAKHLAFDWQEQLYNFNEVESLLVDTIYCMGDDLANAVNVGVGSVEIAGITALQKTHPCSTQFFSGLGSEELFAGYQRHKEASNKHDECWRGLDFMFTRDLLRDKAIEKAYNVSFIVPFLDEEVVTLAMSIPDSYKITDKGMKMILREAAVKIGLPKEFSFRKKRAAQYGARTDQALFKIAKRNGFSYKKDYIAQVLKNKPCLKNKEANMD